MAQTAPTKITAGADRTEVPATDDRGGHRLDSWKAIAAYLGRDSGTVRRWERTRGLPVHRVPGGKGSSVFAFTDEIDTWLRSAPRESADTNGTFEESAASLSLPAWGRWAAAATILIGIVGLAWRLTARAPEPARLEIDERSVTAVAEGGERLWEHALEPGHRHIKSAVSESSHVIGGAAPAVYFTTSNRLRIPDNFATSGELTSLTVDGEPRWTFKFADALTVGGKPYGEPWAITGFAVESAERSRRIAVASHHWLWSASILAILDDTGKRLGTYVNSGWIEQVRWLSRDRLAFAGFHEEMNGGLVGLVDPSHLDGQSPAAPDSPYYCQTCGADRPVKLVVMPRSEVNLASQSRFNRAVLEITGDGVIARTVEVPADVPVNSTRQGAADALYEFTTNLELVRATFSQRYWDVHAELEAQKKLDHDRAHCPDREGPRFARAWSPNGGWREIAIR